MTEPLGRGAAEGMGDSDAALVARSRGGDVTAFDELVCRHQQTVYRLAYRLLGSHEDAADATQEAFLRAYGSLAHFRADGNFRNWLLAITTNHCLSYRRYRQRRLMTPLEEAANARRPDWADEESEDPQQVAAGRQELQRVKAAIGALPDRQRMAISLFTLDNVSIAGVAKIMRCSQGTVKATIHRARENLRRMLAGEGD